MAILSIQFGSTGLSGVVPQQIYINTDDTIAEVTAAGYLNSSISEGYNYFNKQMALVGTEESNGVEGCNWYKVSVAAGVVTLTAV